MQTKYMWVLIFFIFLLGISYYVSVTDAPPDRKTNRNAADTHRQATSRYSWEPSNTSYLPSVKKIQNQFGYTYYEAYTFAYRYASVKASLAKDAYWIRVYARSWDKYAYDKGHRSRLTYDRFYQIMEAADRFANQ